MKKLTTLLLLGLVAAQGPALADKLDFSKLDLTKLPPPADKAGVTYANDIRPLFEASCFGCHGEHRQRGDLRVDSLEAVLKGGKDGKVIVPGNSEKSPLVVAVSQIDDKFTMPPKFHPRRGGPGGFRGPGGPPGGPGGPGGPPPGRFGGPGGPGRPGGRGHFGPPPKPLTAAQVSLIRAWVDQGAK
jgi:Planctomycete cytochrome C